MPVQMKDLKKWIKDCVADDHNFNTKALDPEAQTAKEMIREIIRKLKGRID